MKLEPFNHSTKQWDRFREFYNTVDITQSRSFYHEPFIHLETGEFIVTASYLRPKYRKPYPDYGVAVVSSDDYGWTQKFMHDFKLTTPDGDEVKSSWLNHKGAQHLWIDKDTMTVVTLERCMPDKADKRIPARLRGKAHVYYAAPNEQPIGATTIRVVEVDKLDTTEKEHIKAIVAACKAWNTLSEEAIVRNNEWPHHAQIYNNGQFTPNKYYYPRAKAHVDGLLQLDFASMTWAQRKQVAMQGVQSRNKTTEYAYLKLIQR